MLGKKRDISPAGTLYSVRLGVFAVLAKTDIPISKEIISILNIWVFAYPYLKNIGNTSLMKNSHIFF